MAEPQRTPEVFEAFIKPQLPRLFRLARSLAREPADAEEIVQETCLKAFRALHQLRPGSDARAWLITILLNTYRDWVRQTLRRPQHVSFDDLITWPQACQNPEDVTVQTHLGRLVRLALDDLPPDFRLAVLLADVEGFTYKEIADITGCPVGTVMSRLYRGRHLLQATLRAVLEE
jgi:RNA polymerase sigma-70 factor (ECF subfamily)